MTEDNQKQSDENEPARETTSPERAWTKGETEHLRTWYGVKDDHFLARELKRDPDALREKAWEVFDTAPREGPWTSEDTDTLRSVLGALDVAMIARMLGRTPEAVEQRIVELATSLEQRPLNNSEVVRFKRLYGTRSDEDLAIIFGRTIDVIESTGSELCLSKDKAFLRRATGGAEKTPMPRWSKSELEKLRDVYPRLSNLEIAQSLGRSVKSVVSKAHNLGLKKDRARLQQMGRQNVKLRYEKPGSDGKG